MKIVFRTVVFHIVCILVFALLYSTFADDFGSLDDNLYNENNKKLIELYKRSTNILAIEEKKDNKKFRGRPSVLGFKSKYERLLYRRIKQISRDFYKFITKAEFEKAFALLAVIEAPLDHFFEHVVVNDVDNYARENRLVLLAMIRDLFHEVGDLSKVGI